MTGVAARLAGLSTRERALVIAAAALAGAVATGTGLHALGDDLATRRARVASHERELAEVRRLALALGREGTETRSDAGSDASLVARLEAAADAVVGRERIASMTPGSAPVDDGAVEERVTLRVAGASLAETVRLLHALEGQAGLGVARLDLRKHPDDPGRFDATFEVARLGGPP